MTYEVAFIVGQVMYLPDKEFRWICYLDQSSHSTGGPCFRMTSSRRREVRTISSSFSSSEDGWRMVSEDSQEC